MERQARKLAAGREKQIDQHTDREAGPLETPGRLFAEPHPLKVPGWRELMEQGRAQMGEHSQAHDELTQEEKPGLGRERD